MNFEDFCVFFSEKNTALAGKNLYAKILRIKNLIYVFFEMSHFLFFFKLFHMKAFFSSLKMTYHTSWGLVVK